MNFIIGIILGFCIATYGVSGVASAIDESIQTIKHVNINVEK